ncbi:MAG: S8 family serine peptidase [Methylococcaceae bacterium]
MKLATWVIGLALPLAMHTAFAANSTPPPVVDPSLIEGSYFITFTDPVGTEKPILDPPGKLKASEVAFGEHSSGQSKQALEKALGLNGKIMRIFDTINSIHVLMDAKEAYRFSLDRHVKNVTQNRMFTAAATTQNNADWGLSRLNQTTAITPPNYPYAYQHTGATQTIWILDSGLTLSSPAVAAEFGGRAFMVYDFNSVNGVIPDGTEYGRDCVGHGTKVASVAAGKTYGVAKGAYLKIVKISKGCAFFNENTPADNYIAAINYIATYAQRGTIINVSNYLHDGSYPGCIYPAVIPQLETAIVAAYNRGIIFVTSAGNDGCDTANYSPSRIPEAFVVGATSNKFVIPNTTVPNSNGKDALMQLPPDPDHNNYVSRSRKGWNISAFAPGQGVMAMNTGGEGELTSGTSMASPYIAGVFALYCEHYGNCATRSVASIYQGLRDSGTLGTVTEPDSTTPLTGATSRFIRQQW